MLCFQSIIFLQSLIQVPVQFGDNLCISYRVDHWLKKIQERENVRKWASRDKGTIYVENFSEGNEN